MLHYPHLNIPEERFAWIYPLSIDLEPKAEIYWWEDHQQDIKDSWGARLEGKELQTHGGSQKLVKLCLPLLKQYPRIHCFFFYLIDAHLMQGNLDYAAQLIERRKQWMIDFPYKVIGQSWTEYGKDKEIVNLPPMGYRYYLSMTDWIGAMRSIQFYEIDIQHKIDTGFVFRPRRQKK